MRKIKIILVFLFLMSIASVRFSYADPIGGQLNNFYSMRTVRLIIEQSYTEARRNTLLQISLPFESLARELLEYAGLKVVREDAKNYDATLKIQAKGEARGRNYAGDGEIVFRYANASLSGSISLETSNNLVFQETFAGSKKPEWIPKDSYLTATDAPFYEIMNESFQPLILKMIGKVYGFGRLSSILKRSEGWAIVDGGSYTGHPRDIAVIMSLKKIGKPAVESLVALLKDENKWARYNAVVHCEISSR